MENKLETKKEDVTTVPAGQMGALGWHKWLINMLRFLLPVLSLYFGYVSEGLQDGLHSSDFIPNAFIGGTMSLYVINSLQDLITKFTTEKKYADGEKI